MILILLITFVFTASAYRLLPEDERQSGNNILHKYVASIIDLPYHVLVVYKSLFCSGSLIRSRIVITAASCFLMKNPGNVVVKVGAGNVVARGQVIRVLEVKIHEYFNHLGYLDNDIAMLVLKNNVVFGPNVKKVVMVEPDVALRPGISVAVSGWGGGNLQSKYANMLLWSEMVVMSTDACQSHYGNLLTHSNFCAKYQPDRRLSDNGGPAVFNNLLVGILSFGAANISMSDMSVALLTNVSYFHRWTVVNSRQFLTKYCISEDSEDISD